jgi:F-type H+-transporting ATPase subunit delta
MAEKRTSHAYAQMLLELATASWLRGLRLASRRLREGQLAAKLEDPATSTDEKTRLLAPVLSDLTPPVASVVRSLVTDGELNKLDTIVDEFEALVVRRSTYMLAHVRSAVLLTDAERKQLEANLVRRFGNDLEFEYEQDPALIGGVVVRVGDEVIDGSLAGKLSALRERLV